MLTKRAPAPRSTPQEIQEDLERLHAFLDSLLATLRSAAAEAGQAGLEKVRECLWSAAHELDMGLDDLLMPKNLDLDRDDPATARRLHGFLVWRHFSPHPSGDPGELLIPEFTPEQGDLKVYYMYGRWFCTWLKLDEDMSRSENDTRELLMITRNEDGRLGFVEV